MSGTSDQLEQEINSACQRGDYSAAATRALAAYGGEIYRFIAARMGDDEAAAEVFSVFAEDLWRALPDFAWRCSMRTWAFKIAHHGLARHRVRSRREQRRLASLSEASELQLAARTARSETPAHQKTSNKARLAALRARLSDEDQTLLMLRVDRRLSWLALSEVMAAPDAALSEAELKRAAARLRKRFQAIKERLRRLSDEGEDAPWSA